MYKRLGDSLETVLELKPLVANAGHCEVVIAPVFVHLKTLADRLEGSNIGISAQDCAEASEDGAHTGEVSASMLSDVGCTHVILGHSERRQFCGETDGSVRRKAKAAIAAGLSPIVCVGESLEERDSGRHFDVVGAQLRASLDGLTTSDLGRIIIAYEPVWAIGTGKTASPEQAQEMHGHLRRVISATHGKEVAEATRILYGGSVKPENIRDLMEKPDIDGALVGGASLKADSFAAIVNYLKA